MRQMIDNTLFTSRQARSLHYQRHIEPEGEDSLARLLRLIPKGTSVLELGPATGYCSRYLHEALGCTVDAVELVCVASHAIRRYGRFDVNAPRSILDKIAGRVAQMVEILAMAINPWRGEELIAIIDKPSPAGRP